MTFITIIASVVAGRRSFQRMKKEFPITICLKRGKWGKSGRSLAKSRGMVKFSWSLDKYRS